MPDWLVLRKASCSAVSCRMTLTRLKTVPVRITVENVQVCVQALAALATGALPGPSRRLLTELLFATVETFKVILEGLGPEAAAKARAEMRKAAGDKSQPASSKVRGEAASQQHVRSEGLRKAHTSPRSAKRRCSTPSFRRSRQQRKKSMAQAILLVMACRSRSTALSSRWLAPSLGRAMARGSGQGGVHLFDFYSAQTPPASSSPPSASIDILNLDLRSTDPHWRKTDDLKQTHITNT